MVVTAVVLLSSSFCMGSSLPPPVSSQFISHGFDDSGCFIRGSSVSLFVVVVDVIDGRMSSVDVGSVATDAARGFLFLFTLSRSSFSLYVS